VLGAIRYQPNRAVLHTDVSMLPRAARLGGLELRRRRPASSRGLPALPAQPAATAALEAAGHRLAQSGAADRARPGAGHFEYAHPVFDAPRSKRSSAVPRLQGRNGTYYCGAWTGYGFHEDGLKSGLAAARALLPTRSKRRPGRAAAPHEEVLA
jgi:predicted NAD/FAD-binding protein